MLRRPGRWTDRGELLLVASDPKVIAATRDAARRLYGKAPVLLTTPEEALTRLVGPGDAPRHLVMEHGRAHRALLEAAGDPFLTSSVLVISPSGLPLPAGLNIVPTELADLADALQRPGPSHAAGADAAELRAGMSRGEITVRFQPLVRICDRRPLMLEALARWERPSAPLGAGAFIPVAERHGLAAQLTIAVAERALRDFRRVRGRRQLRRLSFNMPLSVLLRPDAAAWLACTTSRLGVAPSDLLLELTESTEVRDVSLLRRALGRLRRAGFGVLLDDLGLDDPRLPLLKLPFAGVKLDRFLVAAVPRHRRARALVEQVVRLARRRGMVVVAEGVTDPRIWRAVAAAGCDLAQGYGVGRPLPVTALPAWVSAWSAVSLAMSVRQPG